MKKRDEIEQPGSCLNKALADEPIFVIRGKDASGADTVRAWANHAERSGKHEPEKIQQAREMADEMDQYRAGLAEAANPEKTGE